MGQILNDPKTHKTTKHKCWDEIPKTGRELTDGTNRLENQAVGIVFRCSCGKLYHTVRDLSSWSKWTKAGLCLRFKYRNEGKDDNGQF